ncbi:MAG: molybdopterin oxidoreductase family protein [Hyphomicrobiaceae bacterium]|nr:molybdopterin oxidoreductase family protein [Hyphomicrobiaceae bacterium]
MNQHPRIVRSVCPHDCPSTCALDIEIGLDGRMGRVRGARDDPYTAGVICEKVARYAERQHHPDRLLHPLKRAGRKGEGRWTRISWDDALDEITTRFHEAEREFGTESVWPYYYAGTMGHVHRDSIHKMRHLRSYSGQYQTICSHVAYAGYLAGTGLITGVDPVEMSEAGCVVIWGTNPVNTQVNLMTHAMRAKKNGARLVVIDIYRTGTMEQADMPILLRPGSDGAFALATMHVLVRDGLADREYLRDFTDFSPEFESHLETRTPEWAASITGLGVTEIEAFAHLVGTVKATYFRLGFGFTRQNNGITNMHAAQAIAAITGAWKYPGGGAFHSHGGGWGLNKTPITASDVVDPDVRMLDMSQIGRVLTGDAKALRGGGPVKAMIIQNTNPIVVAPEQELVKKGFARDDLFVAVHEQFMTETAQWSDIVLPATMFTEHNDYYTRGGHNRILLGPAVMDAPGECRSNYEVIRELSVRLGTNPNLFPKSDGEVIEKTFEKSVYGDFATIQAKGFVDRAFPVAEAHFATGFAWPDRRYRFAPDWEAVRKMLGYEWHYDPAIMPRFADYFDVNEKTDADHPFKLATSPARTFLNTSFTETPGSRKREGSPRAFLHPDDAGELGIGDGDMIQIGNKRGQVTLAAALFDGLRRGVVIVESIHPNADHPDGRGINTLINAERIPPFGGAAFHDAAVWVRRAAQAQ